MVGTLRFNGRETVEHTRMDCLGLEPPTEMTDPKGISVHPTQNLDWEPFLSMLFQSSQTHSFVGARESGQTNLLCKAKEFGARRLACDSGAVHKGSSISRPVSFYAI